MIKLSTGLRQAILGTNDFKTIFTDSVLEIYSGSAPATADDAETGTKLCRITVSSGTFTAGSAAAGLEFGTPSAGVIAKASAEVWSGVNLATGTAGYYRLYSNAYSTGSSASHIRLQGTVGTSGADMTVASTAFTSGATTTVDTFSITLPAA